MTVNDCVNVCVCMRLCYIAKLFNPLFCRSGPCGEGGQFLSEGLPDTEEITPQDGKPSLDTASGVTHY